MPLDRDLRVFDDDREFTFETGVKDASDDSDNCREAVDNSL
jgi:hypothetical protein